MQYRRYWQVINFNMAAKMTAGFAAPLLRHNQASHDAIEPTAFPWEKAKDSLPLFLLFRFWLDAAALGYPYIFLHLCSVSMTTETLFFNGVRAQLFIKSFINKKTSLYVSLSTLQWTTSDIVFLSTFRNAPKDSVLIHTGVAIFSQEKLIRSKWHGRERTSQRTEMKRECAREEQK